MASPFSSDVMKALRRDDASEVTRLLDSLPRTPALEKRAVKWLIEAIERDKPAVFKALLDWGVDPNGGRGKCLKTPLNQAARFNRLEAAQLLLEAGADPERMDDFRWVALREVRSVEMTTLLLDAGADIECSASGKTTALYWACLNYREDVVALLLARGAQVDPKSCSPLSAAIDRAQPRMVQMLLEAGAQLKRTIEHTTPYEFDALEQSKKMREPNAEVITLLELATQKQRG